MAAQPRLRPDVVFGSVQHRGPVRVHPLRVGGTGHTLEVGVKERFVMARLDGRRTLAEIGAAYEIEFGAVLSPTYWGQVLGSLHRTGLLTVPGEAPTAPRPRVRGGRHTRRRPRTPGRTRTLPLVRYPGPLLDGLLRVTRAAFSPWLAAPLLAAVLAMQVLVVMRLGDLAGQTVTLLGQPGPLFLVGVASWLIAALHELAHGVAARRYAVPVLEIGVRWLPPLVMPYCRTDGYLHLPRRRSQAVIAGAGVLVELALLLPAFAAWWWAPPGATSDALAALVLCGSAHALVNVVPVPPLDGYRLLSHAFGVTDYARQTGIYLTLMARRDPRAAAYHRRARVAYLFYAVVVVATLTASTGLVLRGGYAWLGWTGVAAATGALTIGGAALSLVGLRATRRRAASFARPAPRSVEPAEPPVEPAPRTPPSGGHAARAPDERSARRAVRTHRHREDPPDPGGPPVLVLDGIVKEYGGRRAVDGVRLEVGKGEFLGLLGPNGAGKTTLIEIAVGLRQADAGTVSVLGRCPWPRRTTVLRRIGVQTQSAAFFVRLTAREHLRTVAALYGLGRDAAEDALHLVGLGPHGGTRADRLSGGQQQRLAIAAALVHDPELIFLDEPTASLDPQARRELWSVLRDLHAGGRTLVYTTHHIDEAEALCTRVAIMSGGSVVASGAPSDLIESAGLPTRVVVPASALPLGAALALPGVATASVEGPSVVLQTHHSAAVLAGLEGLGGVRGVQTRTPTLEDVYLDRIRSEPAR